jgi:uncharacterized protein YodC (DUF2158 family)
MKSGDIVELKSGGPKMTVIGRNVNVEENVFYCCWIYDGNYKTAQFRESMLKVVEEK